MNKSLVDSRSMKGSTSSIPINSGLDPALLKHLNAFDGFKLDGSYRFYPTILATYEMFMKYLSGVTKTKFRECKVSENNLLFYFCACHLLLPSRCAILFETTR